MEPCGVLLWWLDTFFWEGFVGLWERKKLNTNLQLLKHFSGDCTEIFSTNTNSMVIGAQFCYNKSRHTIYVLYANIKRDISNWIVRDANLSLFSEKSHFESKIDNLLDSCRSKEFLKVWIVVKVLLAHFRYLLKLPFFKCSCAYMELVKCAWGKKSCLEYWLAIYYNARSI